MDDDTIIDTQDDLNQDPTPSEDEVSDPEDILKRLDAIELEKFCRFEAEIKVCLQALRIVDFEAGEAKRSLQIRMAAFENQKQRISAELNAKLRPQYNALLAELADKYGISEPARMLIDTDAGTIRDSSELGS